MVKSRPLRLVTSLFVAAVFACAPSSVPSSIAAADSLNEVQTDIWFMVSDRDGQCVSGLRTEDVRVTEDGVPQHVRSFVARRDAPRSVVIAIDKSGSQEFLLPSVKKVAQALAAVLVRPPTDRVAVVSFAEETMLEQDFTGEVTLAQKAIDGLIVVDPNVAATANVLLGKKMIAGATSMHDALWVIGGEVFASAPPDSRRVLVLLTDGVDTASQTKKRESVARLLGANVSVYALGVGDPKNYEGIDKSALKDLAERTGGQAYFPRKDPEVRAAFAEIEQSLGCQNWLSYVPANGNPTKPLRKLKIEIVNPELRKQGLRVTHREGYVFGQAPVQPRGK